MPPPHDTIMVLTDDELRRRTTEIRINVVEETQMQLSVQMEENTALTTGIKAGMEEQARKTTDIKDSMDEQARKTVGMQDDLAEIVAAFRAGKGAFKVLGFLGKVAKWATIILAFITAVYGAIHAIKTGLPK